MSLKWTGGNSESGILRKSEPKEKREELFVFGYSCKLFRDDDKALHIDQGKHLIPWMGDESLKIDSEWSPVNPAPPVRRRSLTKLTVKHFSGMYTMRWYDGRGALHELSRLEAPPGGFDWRVELTRNELEVEQLCDEERYRALHTNEDEEEMYKEEELKRLHAAGYGQVSFNYDNPSHPSPTSQPTEVDEPFVPSDALKEMLPDDIVLPDSLKLNAIVEKTAKFIASQGAQMEILIKAKQRDNPQFQFLNKESPLNPYYMALINLIKAGKWPEKNTEPVEDKPPENEEYLHPSLASTVIESAPSIPSIHYKPSADCDYTLLISKMRGEPVLDEAYIQVLAPGEVPPPGTEPLPPRGSKEISRAPVMYKEGLAPDFPPPIAPPPMFPPFPQYNFPPPQLPVPPVLPPPMLLPPMTAPPSLPPPNKPNLKSTGLSLMKNYNTDSDSDDSDSDTSSTESKEKPIIITPPEDIQVVIDKMAGYVARNGVDFEKIVRAKNDPRFTFLEPGNIYHTYYKKLMQEKRGDSRQNDDDKQKPTVSFSIKKMKEPEPILPKPALAYESSSEDETGEKKERKQAAEQLETPKTNIPQIISTNNQGPPIVVYKLEAAQVNNLPVVKAIETKPKQEMTAVSVIPNTIITKPIVFTNNTNNVTVENNETVAEKPIQTKEEPKREKTPKLEKKERDRGRDDFDYKKEKKRHKERKKDRDRDRSRSEKDYRKERKSVEVERRERREREGSVKERDSDRHKKMYNKQELENEIISLEENDEELIDLTGDVSDSKADTEVERARKSARRQRAAEFLRRAGVEPSTLPASSLGSAMVDTLETIRKKKEQEQEKRRRREKRRHRERRGNDEYDRSHRKSKRRKYSDDESDYDGSKKKKRKKDKRPSKYKKKSPTSENDLFEDAEMPVTIDIVSTLKELRNNSPTKELVGDLQDTRPSFVRESSGSDRETQGSPKRKKREYSEGEWSSDSASSKEE